MCGRSACALAADDIRRRVHAVAFDDAERYRPSYNVRPSDVQPVVVHGADGRRVRAMRWGVQRSGHLVINARSESLGKAVWRAEFARCVVVAQGFFEWSAKSAPYYLHPIDDKLLTLAGIYDPKEGAYAIVTTAAPGDLTWLHERMPVVLAGDEQVERWLSTVGELGEIDSALLKSPESAASLLAWHEVGNLVNGPTTTSECILSLEEARKKYGLDRFFGPLVAAAVTDVKKEVKQESASPGVKPSSPLKLPRPMLPIPEKASPLEGFKVPTGSPKGSPMKKRPAATVVRIEETLVAPATTGAVKLPTPAVLPQPLIDSDTLPTAPASSLEITSMPVEPLLKRQRA